MVEGADPERKADVCSDCRFGDRDSYALAIRAGGSGGCFPAYLFPVKPTNRTQTCDRDAGLDGKFSVLRSGMDNVNNWRFISEINPSGSEYRLPKGRCSARRSLFCLQYRPGEPRFPRLGAEVSAQGGWATYFDMDEGRVGEDHCRCGGFRGGYVSVGRRLVRHYVRGGQSPAGTKRVSRIGNGN